VGKLFAVAGQGIFSLTNGKFVLPVEAANVL